MDLRLALVGYGRWDLGCRVLYLGIEVQMEYSDYSYSSATQAEFYKAESKLLLFNANLPYDPCARYMRYTMLAFEAVFAIRMAKGIVLPVVPLINAFNLANWKYQGDTSKSVGAQWGCMDRDKDERPVAVEALNYMNAVDWIASNVHPDMIITIDTILYLHEILTNGVVEDNRYHGFRRSFLPYKKGIDPILIPTEIDKLCGFANGNFFSPLGQASIIHHAFESIVPFDTLIDRTGLVFAITTMFKRNLFSHGHMVPICWGASIDMEFRRKLKDSSRDNPSENSYRYFKECWAIHNARNTYISVIIAESFLAAAINLRTKWRSQGLKIPSNSALDRLLELFLAIPELSIMNASKLIGKSYGATNEAMNHLVKAGIVKEVALDGRERSFVCGQSTTAIEEFIDKLMKMGTDLAPSSFGNN